MTPSHFETCATCRAQPFALCRIGAALIRTIGQTEERTCYAWAVRLKTNRPGVVLAGRYYFATPAPSHEGSVVALFATEATARAGILTRDFCYQTPVRVRVTVTRVRPAARAGRTDAA